MVDRLAATTILRIRARSYFSRGPARRRAPPFSWNSPRRRDSPTMPVGLDHVCFSLEALVHGRPSSALMYRLWLCSAPRDGSLLGQRGLLRHCRSVPTSRSEAGHHLFFGFFFFFFFFLMLSALCTLPLSPPTQRGAIGFADSQTALPFAQDSFS